MTIFRGYVYGAWVGLSAAVIYLELIWVPARGIKAAMVNELTRMAVTIGAFLVGSWGGALIGWRLTPPAPANACKACGFDIRATPLRCPECGQWT